MRCWKSQERMMLVACLGRTPLLFLDFLSSLSNRDDRSMFTLDGKTREGKKRGADGTVWLLLPQKQRETTVTQEHLLKRNHGNWIWVTILEKKKINSWTPWQCGCTRGSEVWSVFGASTRTEREKGQEKVWIPQQAAELVKSCSDFVNYGHSTCVFALNQTDIIPSENSSSELCVIICQPALLLLLKFSNKPRVMFTSWQPQRFGRLSST